VEQLPRAADIGLGHVALPQHDWGHAMLDDTRFPDAFVEPPRLRMMALEGCQDKHLTPNLFIAFEPQGAPLTSPAVEFAWALLTPDLAIEAEPHLIRSGHGSNIGLELRWRILARFGEKPRFIIERFVKDLERLGSGRCPVPVYAANPRTDRHALGELFAGAGQDRANCCQVKPVSEAAGLGGERTFIWPYEADLPPILHGRGKAALAAARLAYAVRFNGVEAASDEGVEEATPAPPASLMTG